jgi:3-methyladenine DNA glycosylase AlkD
MAAYMKTEMPFYGIAKPERLPVYREMKKRFPASDREDYEAGVLALWNLPHREEKYAALDFAKQNERFVDRQSLPLYEHLIRDGAWWDLVDEIATHLSGRVLLRERAVVKPIIKLWITDEDMWVRRSALLSQIGHKDKTDTKQLFGNSLLLAHEKEFFIRKAIGWALRDYSWANPDAVIKFLHEHGHKLSPLSRREGAKRLIASGLLSKDDV